MNDQYRGSIKQNFAWWDIGGADIPHRLFTDFNEKYKAWEKRRGFSNETDFIGNPIDKNKKKLNPVKQLRGVALRAKLALDNKKKILMKKKTSTKAMGVNTIGISNIGIGHQSLANNTTGVNNVSVGVNSLLSNTSGFSPDIVGKQYSSGNNARRKIKEYILKNHLIIPADYEFGVNKIDWGSYEITGSRIQIKK